MGRKRRRRLHWGVKRSVEEDHVEDVHDDTLDIEHLHSINVVTSKFDSVDEQNELIGRISAKIVMWLSRWKAREMIH